MSCGDQNTKYRVPDSRLKVLGKGHLGPMSGPRDTNDQARPGQRQDNTSVSLSISHHSWASWACASWACAWAWALGICPWTDRDKAYPKSAYYHLSLAGSIPRPTSP